MVRVPFKFFRRTVAQRRMQSLLIVVPVDKFLDVSAQVIEIAILVGVDFFPLQSLQKTFAAGVVVRIRRAAHARNHSMPFENGAIVFAGILHAAIGMMDQTGCRLSRGDGLFQCGQRETTGQGLLQRPTHDLARKSVKDHRQVDEFGFQSNVGDVSHPQLIHPG